MVLKRDGVLLNATIADAAVEGDRIVDQVAAVQVNHCEAGGYILQVEAFDEDGIPHRHMLRPATPLR